MWWRELFEDADGRMSMTRLLMFLSFFPASGVVLWQHEADTLGWYLSAYAAAYGFGKIGDSMSNKEVKNIRTVTTVEKTTEPAKTELKASDVNIQAEGDINLK